MHRSATPAKGAGRFAIVGAHVDNDLVFAEHLVRFGHDVSVFRRKRTEEGERFGAGGFSRFGAGDVIEYSGPVDLVSKIRGFDYVFTFTASYPFALFYLLPVYPLLTRLGWPQYMNIGTGSDFSERIVAGGLDGFLQRLGCRNAHMNMVLNYPGTLRNVAKLRLSNACVLPFPYIPAKRVSGDSGVTVAASTRKNADEFLVFHPSHLDWGQTDNAAGRTSTKGNDRFIRALARFRQEGGRPFRATLLDRGSDRVPARRLVESLGLSDCVVWREHMTRDEFFATVCDADLVVDQFEVGGLGGIAWESMSLGTPVLMHLAQPNDLLSYDEETPILQAKSENDILAALHTASDPGWRDRQRVRIADWMKARDPRRMIPRYLLYASLATGKDFCGFWATERLAGVDDARR